VISALGRLPALRIARSRRLWLGFAGWSCLTLAFAVAARRDAWAHGADRVLTSVYGALALPFVACAIARAACAGKSMLSATASLVAFGAHPRRAALVTLLVGASVTALFGACLAALVAIVAHGSSDPPAAGDALVSAYVGGLGGAAYAAWFSLGTTVGRRGGGRLLLLAGDWLLGESHSSIALVTPRSHLRNLLGGSPPDGISERTSALVMLVLVVVCTLLTLRGSQRR
jgi:hypothetical protein